MLTLNNNYNSEKLTTSYKGKGKFIKINYPLTNILFFYINYKFHIQQI